MANKRRTRTHGIVRSVVKLRKFLRIRFYEYMMRCLPSAVPRYFPMKPVSIFAAGYKTERPTCDCLKDERKRTFVVSPTKD